LSAAAASPAGRPGLKSGVGLNVLSTAVTIGAGILTVPVILSGVGTAGYGVWALARTMTLYAGTVEQGMGPAIQRYVSAEQAESHADDVNRALWTAMLAYSAIGLLLGAIVFFLAPVFVEIFSIPSGDKAGALTLFRTTGGSLFVGLSAVALINVLQGLQRFPAVTTINVASTVLFVAGVAYFSLVDPWLGGLGFAALAQQVFLFAGRAFALRKTMSRPALLPRAEIKHLAGFSARLQVSGIALLVSTQTDKVIVGLIAGPTIVAEVAIGAQIAESIRLLQNSALTPITTHLSAAWSQGREAAAALAARIATQWHTSVVVIGALFVCCMPALVLSWVGSGHYEAAGYGAALVLAYSAYLRPSASFSFLRAQQRPRIEIKFALMTLVLNLVFSIVGGLLFKAPGVVGATVVANLIATVWVARALREDWTWSVVPRHMPWGRAALAIAIAALAGAIAWLPAQTLPQGVSMVPVGIVLAAGALAVALVGGLVDREGIADRLSRFRSSPSR
jgi:O-antigen/teichoic acid export membrane protein